MKVNTKLSTYEVFALTNILLTMIITDTTPSIIAQNVGNAFWYVPLISFLIVFPSLLIFLYLLNKHDAEHLVDLLEILLGKFPGKLLAFLIFLLAFLTITFEKRSYVNQVKFLYFEQSSITIIFALLIIACIFGAIRGIKVIGYTAKILLPYFIISIILLAVLIFPSIVPDHIYPIFGYGLRDVIKEGILKGSLSSSFVILTMIMPAVREPKRFYKGGLIGIGFSMIQITFFYFLYTSYFDYHSIVTTPFPFHEITQYVKLGDFFTNIETLFLVFWLLVIFIRFILLLYLVSWLFGAIFNIDNFELLILPLAFLMMVIGLMPDNATTTEIVYRNQLLNLLTPVMVIFPYILLVGHFFKR